MTITTPDEMDGALVRTFNRNAAEWLLAEIEADSTGERIIYDQEYLLRKPIRRVTEREALKDLPGLKYWCDCWHRVECRSGWRVQFRTANWRNLGIKVELPVSVQVDSPLSLCSALAPAIPTAAEWEQAKDRIKGVLQRFHLPAESAMGILQLLRKAKALWHPDFTDQDAERLMKFVEWLLEHPQSNLFIREIPVAGADSKWFEKHFPLVFGLWGQIREHRTGKATPHPQDFMREAGLREKPVFVRMRHATYWTGGDPEDVVQLTLDRLIADPCPAEAIVVIENDQTGLAVKCAPDVPIVFGMGYGVTALAAVKWLQEKRVLYCGDLDTHGLAILAECRRILPQTESFCMSSAVYEQWKNLAVKEPSAVTKCPPGLTKEERELFYQLSENSSRLEQERIPQEEINFALLSLLASDFK